MRHRLIPRGVLVGLVVFEIILCRHLVADEPKQPVADPRSIIPARVEEIIWWLPTDTQTVTVEQEPLRFLAEPDDKGLSVSPPWPPAIVRKGALSRQLAGKNVILRVEGARRFRVPKDLGLMPYEGATVAVFEQGLDASISKSLHEGATRTETIEGSQVSMFSQRYEMNDWTLYICQPKPNVLIGATDRGYLAELLRRIENRASSRALPADLPEWKLLDPVSPCWGIRHYDVKDAKSDPTSPLGGREGWYFRDDDAVGMVFTFDARRHKATVKHLSSSKDAASAVTKYWQNEQLEKKPQVQQAEPGVVEVSATFGQGEPDPIFLFLLSTALGHGVCL